MVLISVAHGKFTIEKKPVTTNMFVWDNTDSQLLLVESIIGRIIECLERSILQGLYWCNTDASQ